MRRSEESMSDILIKLGGGLITDKSRLRTVEENRIESVARVIAVLLSEGHSVRIVHGAGSFGHLKAKEWSLSAGADPLRLDDQLVAVNDVRMDMRKLNSIVRDVFESQNINVSAHPPSIWATGTGPSFAGDLSRFESLPQNTVAMTFGDVVDCPPPAQFGILSGDDLMVRMASEMNITHAIFLLGDTEGLLDRPPDQPGAELITLWTPEQKIAGKHDSALDVTGGIFLKIASARAISKHVGNVWLLDGRQPQRVLQLIRTGKTRGTRVIG